MSPEARPPETQPLSPAQLFAALGDETRLQLVDRLAGGKPQSISTLSERTPLTRQAITKHLHVLESAGLVRGTRAGRERLYAFEPTALDALQAYLERVSRHWDHALERLRGFVETN